jgi:hypothetical protein
MGENKRYGGSGGTKNHLNLHDSREGAADTIWNSAMKKANHFIEFIC